MGDTHGAWIPPQGYALCGHGSCGDSEATGAAKNVAEWKCAEGDCKQDGAHKCGCYLVRVRPRSQYVDVLAPPGKTWTWEPMPPGWGTMCLCLYEDEHVTPPPPPRPDLVPPSGYALDAACGDCGMPSFDAHKRTWSCINLAADANPGCYLVEVPRTGKNNKQVHILAGPGEEIHESHLHNDWDVFCVCLKKH